ncbi:MAG: trigger factor [Christensenellaceae bacterium]
MKYVTEKAEKSQIKVTMTIESADWEDAIRKAYEKSKSKFNVQGFRKGKVPFAVICSQYGKEVFYEDALNIAISEYYPQVLAKEDSIHPVGDPDIKLNDFGEEIKLDILIPVMPEVVIESYKGIKVDKVEYNVTDEDVQKDVDRLLDRNSREISVTDRACKEGDTVVIDFSGSVDGVKFEGGTAEKYRLNLGLHSFVPGFEEQVVGMNIGDEKEINVKFPEDYTEELKGKDAVFAIKLHEILNKELPELNDEFIKEATGDESVEAYKQKVRERIQKENDNRAKNETEDKLLDAIAEKTTVEIPDAMVENEISSMIQQLEYRLMYQGIKLDDYLKMIGQTEQDLRASYKDTALPRVKKQLIVNKIIETENIKAEQAEIDAKIAEQAKSVDKEVEEYKKTMDPRQVEYIQNSIIVDKLFEFLINNNEVA